MDHPPSARQKLPTFFHGLTFSENSYQQKKKALVDKYNPYGGCALRTMPFSGHSRGGCATFTLP
jgi:hypothetical protein